MAASNLDAVMAALVTQIETTSIAKCYVGDNNKNTTKYPVAELHVQRGDVTTPSYQIDDYNWRTIIYVRARGSNAVNVALDELCELWRLQANFATLSALNVIEMNQTRLDAPEDWAVNSERVGIIEFDLIIRNTYGV